MQKEYIVHYYFMFQNLLKKELLYKGVLCIMLITQMLKLHNKMRGGNL